MKILNWPHRFQVLVAVLFLVLVCAAINSAVASSTITVVDFHGRSVTLKAPAERLILLESSITQQIAAITGNDFAAKIVGWDAGFRKQAGDGYAKFVEKFPQLKNIPEVGSMYKGTLNVEQVMVLKPDVVIAHEGMFIWGGEATRAALSRLEQAGVPVLFIDYYMDPLQNTAKSTLLLGKILGREERAQALVDFYHRQINLIVSRLQQIRRPKPKVFLECAYNGPGEYGASYGDLAWGSIIKKSGGENIAEPVLRNQLNSLSPDYVLQQNPDIIILTGGAFKTLDSVQMGYLTTQAEVRRTMQPYVNRPGWKLLNAVKNRKVYSIYHEYSFNIYNFAGVQAFAKWFYPEEFKDIDPIAALKEYHKKFMPIDYSGTFICSYF